MGKNWKVQNFKDVNILQINAEFQKDIRKNLNEILLEKKMSNDCTSLLDIYFNICIIYIYCINL